MASYFSLKPFTIFFFIFITITTFFLSSHCHDADNFSKCSIPYDCGEFKDVTFPFWGGRRDKVCGLQGFHLECKEDHSFIRINELEFRILKLNRAKDENKMTIAMANSCSPPESLNATLDFHLFKFNPKEFTNLTLIYNCSEPLWQLAPPPKYFFCGYQGVVYYADDNQMKKLGPHLNQTCHTVQIPILQATFKKIMSGIVKVAEALTEEEFEVEYHVPGMEYCGACRESGGICGSINQTNSFACYCRDHLGDQYTCNHHQSYFIPPQSSTPPQSSSSPPPPKKKNLGLKVGIGIGSACFAVIVMCIVFFFYQRNHKKRNPHSTLFFRNISSDHSSVKDVEKGGSTYLGVHVFTYEELVEATNNFDPSKELGDGGFGTVYYGKLQDGRGVAVKRLYESNYRRVEQFMNEVEILAHVRHPNLVQLYGCTSRHSRELLLVYEYISNGTVADNLHGEKANPGALPWPIRLNIAVESALALTYLHATDIIHRDVKTNNILLDSNFSVKVADFGLSRLFPTHVTHISTAPQGTPGYVDPEYHHCYQLTSKSDVFSFGVVLVELISSMPAVDITRHRHDINLSTMAINRIQNHALHEIVDPSLGFDSDSTVRKMITAVAELAFQCLQNEKDMRPSMIDVLEELKAIQSRDYSPEMAEKKDVVTDEAVLLKNGPLTLSPDSVTANWVSRNTTPNASG